MKPLQLGNTTIQAVLESADVPLAFAEFLPTATLDAIAAERAWLEPQFARETSPGVWHGMFSFHSYVVRTRHHTILVDSCIGNDKNRNGAAGFHMLDTPWLTNLAATGVAPESVDFVMCTHMHADHIGWNTRLANGRWVPTFPNARYLFARREFEHRRSAWELDPGSQHNAYADSVLPVIDAGQAVIVESDHEIDGIVTLEAAPGHTPGNVVIHLRDGGGAGAMLSGDVIHHPLQVKYPEWSSGFCEDPVQSAICRREFVERHAELGTLVLPAHFAAPTAGHIRRDGLRWRFQFAG